MGYTTRFRGEFTLSNYPSGKVVVALNHVADSEDPPFELPRNPGGYCQWELTKDMLHLKWDGGEKFYDYVDWLQWIIDALLLPEGITLSGAVTYQGEEVGDVGTLTIEDNKVIDVNIELVSDELDELIEFRDFVLNHRSYGYEIKREWADMKLKKVR